MIKPATMMKALGSFSRKTTNNTINKNSTKGTMACTPILMSKPGDTSYQAGLVKAAAAALLASAAAKMSATGKVNLR